MSRLFNSAGSDGAVCTITAFADADWSLGAWVYLVTARASSIIFDIDASGTSRQYLLLNLDRTINAYQHHDTGLGNAATLTTTTVALTTWTFLAAVFTASDNKIRIYTGTSTGAMAEAAYSGASPVAGTGTFQGSGTHCHIGVNHGASDGFLGRIENPFGATSALSLVKLEALRLGNRSILGFGARFGFQWLGGGGTESIFTRVTQTPTGLTADACPPVRSYL